TFSEGLNMQSLGRFSAMLVPHSGGLTTGGSGYADVPVNAKLAFNPNTNQLIMVPTQPLANSVYLFSMSGMKATNGDTLTNAPVYSTFQLAAGALPAVSLPSSSPSTPVPAGSIATIPRNDSRSSGTQVGGLAA